MSFRFVLLSCAVLAGSLVSRDARSQDTLWVEEDWRVVGRGVIGTDSASVMALRGWDAALQESLFVRVHIETSTGRVVHTDTLENCESLAAAFVPWRGGVRIDLIATWYQCYGDCASIRYFFTATSDTVAISDWLPGSWFDRRSEDPEPRFIWNDEAGVRWRLPVHMVVSATRITLEEQLPPAAMKGELFPVEVTEGTFFPRIHPPGDPVTKITMYPSSTATFGSPVAVPDDVHPVLISGVARIETIDGVRTPRLVRVLVKLGNTQGWLDRHELGLVGWIEP